MTYEPPKLYIHGSIDTELFSTFSAELAEIELRAPKNFKGYVDVELVSDGGFAYDALAFYDRIEGSRIKIRITGSGLVASAAVIILAAGHHRRLTKNAWVMVHEDSYSFKNEKTTNVEKLALHSRRLENQWVSILVSVTRINEITWNRLHKEETYLSPLECKAIGLIEEIM